MTYKIQLPPDVDPKNVSVQARLFYQSIPPYYLNDRFTASKGDGHAAALLPDVERQPRVDADGRLEDRDRLGDRRSQMTLSGATHRSQKLCRSVVAGLSIRPASPAGLKPRHYVQFLGRVPCGFLRWGSRGFGHGGSTPRVCEGVERRRARESQIIVSIDVAP